MQTNMISIVTLRRTRIDGRDTPPATEVLVPPDTALNFVSTGRGQLVNPDDARRLQRHAWAQCPSRGLPGGGF